MSRFDRSGHAARSPDASDETAGKFSEGRSNVVGKSPNGLEAVERCYGRRGWYAAGGEGVQVWCVILRVPVAGKGFLAEVVGHD